MTEAVTTEEPVVPLVAVSEPLPTFEFDADFQAKLCGMVCRSDKFMRGAGHLIEPDYFEEVAQRAIVKIAKDYYGRYGAPPTDYALMTQAIKDAFRAKMLRKEEAPEVIALARTIYGHAGIVAMDLSGVDFAMDKAAEFARTQAFSIATLANVDLIGRRDFDKIGENMRAAMSVGIKHADTAYDYVARIAERTETRIERASGKTLRSGITTGWMELDALLYHGGWGRKELVTIMGGAKAGKTTALIGFAKAAAVAGHNVLCVTLEVSAAIYGERLDANFTNTKMVELGKHIKDVEEKVSKLKMGKLIIHEFPTGSFTPNDLNNLLEKYAADGTEFGLVVVDYADIMAPNTMNKTDPRENSRLIYVDLRAVMQRWNVAGLTATQTNRAGYMSAVAKAEHVSDDFNKVRIVDLMLSINSTEEERAVGEGRIYFAASRNTEDKFTVKIKQDLARMRFITAILGRE